MTFLCTASFVQAHSPSSNFFDSPEAYSYALDKTIRSIDVCGLLGIKNIVVHSGYKTGLWDKEQWFAENKKFAQKLFPTMEKYGVNVLCENTTRANMSDGYYLISGADMHEFCDYVDHPLFHACWDTGHANIEGGQHDEIIAIGEHLRAVHINDNRGSLDEHIIPFMGTLNMDDVINGLLDAEYKGYFTFESSKALRPNDYWLGNRRKFDGDCRLAEPRLFMQKSIEKLMYEIGEYILKSYDCFEE